MNQPLVSILVAARNEEKVIGELLVSLENLTYPKEKLQVLIGNDASTDATLQVVSEFAKNRNWIQVVDIQENEEDLPLKGKTRVLALLAHQAKGSFYFYTDADIEVPTHWIESILTEFQGNYKREIGVVVGNTSVKPTNWFEKCQAIEWLSALKIMNIFSQFNIPTTGMGNNMAVSATAYWAVGGYEKLPFSIVEDYALYDAIVKRGFGFRHPFGKEVLAYTKPPENYFEQRKRWVTGGMQSKANLILPALLQAFALPFVSVLFFLNYKIALVFLGFILATNFVLGYLALNKTGMLRLFPYIPVYTVYMLCFWFLQFINYFLPTKLIWKGRTYN